MSPVNKMGLHLLTLMVLTSHPSIAIKVYHFCMETNNEIIFRSSFRNYSKFEYEMYSGHLTCLFYKNGEAIGEHCLKAGQVNRFTVIANKTGDEVIVTLTVRDVQKEDEGQYILLVTRDRDGERQNDVIDAYIHVITPPGTAECENVLSSYSTDWIEVHCSAPLGMNSDPQGSIACFQNGKKAPFLTQPEHSVDHIQAVFWMDIETSIKCCSFAPQCEKPPEKCQDFTYSRETKSMLSYVKDPQTGGETTSQTTSQSATSPQTMIYTEGLFNNGQHFYVAVLTPILVSVFFVIFVAIIIISVKACTCVCKGPEKLCIIRRREWKYEQKREVNATVDLNDNDKSTGSPMFPN